MEIHGHEHTPYSLDIAGASAYFGIATKTLRNWIWAGKLHRGHHYLKIGRKPVIITAAFIEFMKREDGNAN